MIRPVVEHARALGLLMVVVLLATVSALQPSPTTASTVWNLGDLFAGVASGNYRVFDNNGAFKEQINGGLGGLPLDVLSIPA